jgi:hypothetical protein
MKSFVFHAIVAVCHIYASHAQSYLDSERRLDGISNTSNHRVRQYGALRSIYRSTGMENVPGQPFRNWDFETDNDPCVFNGIVCEEDYITVLDFEDSSLSGTLPDVFGDFPRLKELRLYNNSLYGTIPRSLLQVQSLRHLHVGYNFLSGRFPDVSDLRVLSRLYLGRNAISGTLPAALCQLTSLELLDISFVTKMWGHIPACFGTMSMLTTFRVTDVGLTGTVPSDLCGLPFGCDAIACPAGSFQGNAGRQTSEGAACRPCDAPSNVIGTTTCQWHESFDRSMAPTPDMTPGPTDSPIIPASPSRIPSPVHNVSPTRCSTSASPTSDETPSPTLASSNSTDSPEVTRQPISSSPIASPAPSFLPPSTNTQEPVSSHPSKLIDPTFPSPSTMTQKPTSYHPSKSISPTLRPPSTGTHEPASSHPSSLMVPSILASSLPTAVPSPSQPASIFPTSSGAPVPMPTTPSDSPSLTIDSRSSTGVLASISSVAVCVAILALFALWKNHWSEPMHARFVDDVSAENDVCHLEKDEQETLGKNSEVEFNVAAAWIAPDQSNLMVTPTSVEALAPTTKRVPSILKTSLSRDQYNTRSKDDEATRKVRFSAPVPLPTPVVRTESSPHIQLKQSERENREAWIPWPFNSAFDPFDMCSSQTLCISETDSPVPFDSAHAALPAVLAVPADARQADGEPTSLRTYVLGIRSLSELSSRKKQANRTVTAPTDIFRQRNEFPTTINCAIHAVSSDFRDSDGNSLGEEIGEV